MVILVGWRETSSPRGTRFAEGDVIEVVDGPLNLRVTSASSSSVITLLATGDTAVVQGGPVSNDVHSWYLVEIDSGNSGWVAGEFIALADSGTFAAGDVIEVADGPVNFREESDLSAGIVMRMETGEIATVLGGPVSADGYSWYEVAFDSETTGWVAGEFFIPSDGSDSGDANFEIGDAVRVATADLNFRAEAGASALILETLDLDALMVVRDGPVVVDGYTWYQVFNYFYGEGWVAGEFLTFEPGGFPTE
jgi:uncharacterized protein YgiM (DUF1202 family)